jgi:hypothetical protein
MMQSMAGPGSGGFTVTVCVTIFVAPMPFRSVREWKYKCAQRTASAIPATT